MKLLIYGGSGYLGSSLINQLNKKNFICSMSRKIHNDKNNFKNIKFLTEISDKNKINEYIADSDLIIIANVVCLSAAILATDSLLVSISSSCRAPTMPFRPA